MDKQIKQNINIWEFLKKNKYELKFVSFFCIMFLSIFMFVVALIPTNPGQSTSTFVYTSSMYAVKFSSNFASYMVIFSPAGWVVLFLSIFAIALLAMTIYLNWNNWKIEYKKNKNDKKEKFFWINKSFTFSLLLIFIILLIFNLIPPNYNALKNWYSAGSNTQNVSGSFWFTPTSWFQYDVTFFVGGYITIIVLFTIFISYCVFGYLLTYILNKMPNLKFIFIFNKSKFANFKANYNKKREEIAKIKNAQKALKEEENELLKNYYDTKINNFDQQISQEELQEQINKNTEIKRKLDELVAKKNEMNKQRNSLSKLRGAIDELNKKKSNVLQNKKEKQKISIPDKELDEIFKSLEID